MADIQTREAPHVDPAQIRKNPNNPRRYFNDAALDLLRTSIQEVGILVPLIVYEEPGEPGIYVLMDGERRWRSALDIGLRRVPVNIIEPPTRLQNILRMFNIHAVREDWPLIAVALSLDEVMKQSGEDRETRLADMTGLRRATVRRAKRLLSLPRGELDRIQAEAHLDRHEQVHREDLYLEIEAAESVLRNQLPEVAEEYPREHIIRQFARKREEGELRAVTDFRAVGKLLNAVDEDLVPRDAVIEAVTKLIDDVQSNPADVFEELAASAYEQQALARKAELLTSNVRDLAGEQLSQVLADQLSSLRRAIDELFEN